MTNEQGLRHIGSVGVLDLRNATAQSIERIRRLDSVGVILCAPETVDLVSRLRAGSIGVIMQAPRTARLFNGQTVIPNDFFRHAAQPIDLFVNGPLIFDRGIPVDEAERGLGTVAVNGQALVPDHLAGLLLSRMTYMNGRMTAYKQGDILVTRRTTIREGFLEGLPDGTSLVITARVTVLPVPNELLRRKVANIGGDGIMRIHQENAASIYTLLGESVGQFRVTEIPAGLEYIDTPLLLDDYSLKIADSKRWYSAQVALITNDVTEAALDKGLQKIEGPGVVLCPTHLSATLANKATSTETRVEYYNENLWLIEDEAELTPNRFDFVDGRETPVVLGTLSIDKRVAPEQLADRFEAIHNFGTIICDRDQLGAIQARLANNRGEVVSGENTGAFTGETSAGVLML